MIRLHRWWTQPSRRTMLLLAAAVLAGILAVFITVTLLGLRETTAYARLTNTNIAGTLATSIRQTLDTYNRSLQGSAAEMRDPLVLALPLDLRRKAVFDQAIDVPGVSEFAVFDAAGNLVMSSNPSRTAANVADRAYFMRQRDDPQLGLYIDGPLVLRPTGLQALVLSRRRTDVEGRFAGIVAATIHLEFFDAMFERVSLNDGSRITLMGSDRRIIARMPRQIELIGKSLAQTVPVQRFESGERFFEAVSALTGSKQLYYFVRVAGYPMVIVVSDSVTDVYASWRHRTWWLGASTFLLVVACIALGCLFLRELNNRRALARHMEQLAHYDSLTGLPNRLLLFDRAAQSLAQAKRDGRRVALMYLDLDGFKRVNDALGHQAGDELLQLVAKRLGSGLRSSDTLSRQGGDEFVVLAPLDGGTQSAEDIVRKILSLAREPYQLGRHGLSVTVSIGIAVFPEDGDHFELLAQRADVAMYRAKHSGKNKFCFYTEEIGRTASQALTGLEWPESE